MNLIQAHLNILELSFQSHQRVSPFCSCSYLWKCTPELDIHISATYYIKLTLRTGSGNLQITFLSHVLVFLLRTPLPGMNIALYAI